RSDPDEEALQVRGTGVDLGEQRLQPLLETLAAAQHELLARPAERTLEALRLEGLQQVVQRVRLEGLQGELVVGGDEDGHRHPLDAYPFEHAEAVEPRHLDIEEDQVRLHFADRFDRLDPVLALPRELHVVLPGEQVADARACQRFIVDDEGLRRHGRAVLRTVGVNGADPPAVASGEPRTPGKLTTRANDPRRNAPVVSAAEMYAGGRG